jgi:hypothetical protein
VYGFYKYVTLARHDAVWVLQICPIHEARRCVDITNMSHSRGMMLYGCYKYVTLARHDGYWVLQICHSRAYHREQPLPHRNNHHGLLQGRDVSEGIHLHDICVTPLGLLLDICVPPEAALIGTEELSSPANRTAGAIWLVVPCFN